MTTPFRIACLILATASSLGAGQEARAQEIAASPSVSSPSAGELSPSLNPLSPVTPAQMTNFLNRPLFTSSRRPYLAPAAVATAPPSPPPAPSAAHMRLVGTVRMPSGASALIQDTTRGVTHSVADGGVIDGWRVTGIKPSGVRIEQGGQSLDLGMFRPGQPASPPSGGAQPMPATIPADANGSQQPPQQQPPSVLPPPVAAVRPSTPGAAPPGTMPGTAAAEAAANSPYRLTFGGAPETPPKP